MDWMLTLHAVHLALIISTTYDPLAHVVIVITEQGISPEHWGSKIKPNQSLSMYILN